MARKSEPKIEFQLDVINQFALLSSAAGDDPLEKFKLLVDSRLDNLTTNCSGDGIADETFPFDLYDEEVEDGDEDAVWAQIYAETNQVADRILANRSSSFPGKNDVETTSLKERQRPCADLDATVVQDDRNSNLVVRPDADATCNSSGVVRPDADTTARSVDQETARALDLLQRRRSGTQSKLAAPGSSIAYKNSRGLHLPDADTTLNLNPKSSSLYKLPSCDSPLKLSPSDSPFKVPRPPKIPGPGKTPKRVIPSPLRAPKTLANTSKNPSPMRPVRVDRQLSAAVSESDLAEIGGGCVGGGEGDVRKKSILPKPSTPVEREGRLPLPNMSTPTRDRERPVRRFRSVGSPFSSPSLSSFVSKNSKSSPVVPRLTPKRQIVGEIALKAASLKAAVENGFGRGKKKTAGIENRKGIDVLPAKPTTRREGTFVNGGTETVGKAFKPTPFSVSVPPPPPPNASGNASKPSIKPRRKRRSLTSGNADRREV